MKIPTDLEILNTIYRIYHSDFSAFDEGVRSRTSKIYVPIDCKEIARELRVDPTSYLVACTTTEKVYGYKQDDGSNVHFFALKVGNDLKCVNFPLMTSVLAGLRQEKKKFWIGTAIAVFALIISIVSLIVSIK
ncbi:MAG: hypothetical protein ACI4QS_03205 [Comamonas sp.]